MGLFDGSFSDPSSLYPLLGLIQGLGTAAQPSRTPVPFASVLGDAGQGFMQGQQAQQQFQSNQFGMANDKFGLQQKLGSVNFLRNLQGQNPLTIDDVMKGNFGSQAVPMGVPQMGQQAPQQSIQAPAPVPQAAAQIGPRPVQAQIPVPQAAPMQMSANQAPQQRSQASGLIPPDLAANPIFQAAIQSGDAATVMSMMTKHQVQLTPEELKAANLPADSLAFKNPSDGTIDIKRAGSMKTPEEIAQAAQLDHKAIMTPQEVAQAGLREGTIAAKDVNGNISIVQSPDVKSPAAEAQDERISAADARAHQTAMIDLLGPDYIDNQAKAIASYRMQPQQSSRNPAVTAAIMGRVYEINPNYDAKQYQAANRAVTAFDTGKQGDQVRSFNTSIAHLNTLGELAGALQNNDVKAINSISNTFKDQFGQAAPTNFDAAKNIVGDEIIKAIIGGGGALADRENAQNQVSRANSPAQLAGVIKTYKALMAGQLGSLKKQYEGSSHLTDFNDKLLPETQRELNNLSAAPSLKPSDLPANARMQLKAGTVTTFGNGSKWTLQNGQPVQVQ